MSHSDNEDDVWGESGDEVEYERQLAENEWGRLQEDHGNTGYKIGIVEGKEVNMQKGFDKGYCEGFATGKAIGKLRGLVSSRIVFYRQILKNEEAAKQLDALFEQVDKTEVNHIYSVDYFRKEKKDANYVSPETFIKDLTEKVNTTLDSVAKKY